MRKLFFAHDAAVVVVALILLGGGWLLAARAARPALKTIDKDGLVVRVPAAWLAEPTADGTRFRGEDAITQLEVRIRPPATASLPMDALLELDRGQAYGQLYRRLGTDRRVVGGKNWLRTEFTYALKPSETSTPRVAYAVEYAFPADTAAGASHIWVVTLHGGEDRVRELEPAVLGSVEVNP